MIWIIVIIIVIIIAYNFGSKSGETIGSVSNSGGMRLKYRELLEYILAGHRDSKIFLETRTYIRAGVSNYGGTTLFHIQQCPGNKVMIDYEIKDNPVVKAFTLRFTFDDNMDQSEMFQQIYLGIQRKMMSL